MATDNEEKNGIVPFNPEIARNLLSALAAPRNNHIELYAKPVQVNIRDLADLARRVSDKFRQLRVDSECALMKALVSLDKDRNYQLVGWNQFERFDWRIPERTKSVVLSWEFMYQRDDESNPELHVLTVRITEAPNPMQFLRAALSRDHEDIERMEIKMAPVVCEVEYVDGLLSRELVELVSVWHKSLRRPAPLSGVGEMIQNRQTQICWAVDMSLEMIPPIAFIAGVYVWMRDRVDALSTNEFINYAAILLMLFTFIVKISNRLSSFTARATDRNIDKMGRFPIFELTNGDQNNVSVAIARITASTLKFWTGIGVSFVINVFSAVFTVYVLGVR